MSTNLSFLQYDPSKGTSILFQDKNLDTTTLWNLFDFLLWRCHQNGEYSINTLLSWYRCLLSSGEGFKSTFCSSSHKFVCGHTITSGDPIYRCRTCQSDNNTLICVDCFKHSNHNGHDWFATYTNGSGCCDCGDPLSWDPKGFCTKHPGPAAGDCIKIKSNIEAVARLLSAFIIYIISHSFDHNNHDVIYLSNNKQCKYSLFIKSFNTLYPQKESISNNSNNDSNHDTQQHEARSEALQQLMNSPLWGFFNRGAAQNNEIAQIVSVLQNEAQREMDQNNTNNNDITEDINDTKEFGDKLKNEENIYRDFEAFKRMQTESKLNDRLLHISVKNKAMIEEQWDAPKDIIQSVLNCNIEEATEITWKLRMFNSAIIAVGDQTYIEKLQQQWIEKDDEKEYDVEIKRVNKDYCRIISKPMLFALIEEISNWCNDSEILKRCIGSAMMLNINHLTPNNDSLKAKGNLKIEIPAWNDKDLTENKNDDDDDDDDDGDIDIDTKNDDNDDNECKMDINTEIVGERENAFYFFILYDHILCNKYLSSLSSLWYALITLPPVKHRVSQILSIIYELMCKTYGAIKRESRHQFIGLTVQFMTIDPIVEICESHGLFTTVLNAYIKLTCSDFAEQINSLKNNQQNIDTLELFKGNEDQYKTDWNIATKSGANHIIFDQRYLLSVDVMMDYLLYNNNNGGFQQFWKRYINMISIIQNSICNYRRHGQHIEYEDRKIINYLRFELNMFFSNQRIILNGLYQCIMRHKGDNNGKYEKALDILIDIIYYGLTLVDKTKYNEIIFDEEESKKTHLYTTNENEIAMKLFNFDGGHLENFRYFRTDRDKVSLVLPLSRFIMNLSALYCEITMNSFDQLIQKLFHKYNHIDSHLNEYINSWFDISLRFVTIFDQFHADLWIKNGDTFRTTMYNYERSEFYYIFYGAHFSLLQSFATQIISPSNLLTLILHRYRVHNWFALNKVQIFNNSMNEDLTKYNKTGWKHWSDSKRTLKMITYTLHTIIAIISEPNYCLLLDDVIDNNLNIKYNDIIKYELIQWLILSSTSMSEIASKIYVHNENETEKEENLRIVLNEIAIYQPPKSMEDTGKFVLKTEFYKQFNPYFNKYDRFNPDFIQSSSDQQSEATEKYLKLMANTNKTNIDDIMFPNWPNQLISYSNDYQLSLLSAPYMGLIWNSILYHVFINDTSRYNIDHLQQCLRLISIAVQILIDSRIDLQSPNGMKLLQNFTQCFDFRLTNKFDHVTDDNKDELMSSKKKHAAKQNKNENEEEEEEGNEEEDEDEDDEYLISSKECKYNLIEIHQKNELNEEGIGSVLWFLCKIFLSYTELPDLPPLNNNNNNNDNDVDNDNDIDIDIDIDDKTKTKPSLNHIPSSQRLLIEQIVTKLYSLKIGLLMNVMRPIWPQPEAMEKSFSAMSDQQNDENNNNHKKKVLLSSMQKRKKKRAKKAKKRLLEKMKKQKEKFALKHQTSIIKDEMEEALEQKQMNEMFGIGVDYHCIVCKSKENQDTMFMMGFAKKCSLLHRCVDNKGSIGIIKEENDTKEEYLEHRKGLNFSFCGHFVHKQCYDTFIINKVRSHYRQEHYYGRGSLTINHFEYACPYCKCINNMVVPIIKVYRNILLNHNQFNTILDITKIEKKISNEKRLNINHINNEITMNHEKVFNSILSRTSSTAFFTKLLWIYDNYQHDTQSESAHDFLKDLGGDNISFIYCNSVSYTISSFELMYRSYSYKQRKDKLTRNISLINTFISMVWTRSQYSAFDYFQLPLLVKYSWDFIHNQILKTPQNDNDDNDNDDNDNDEEKEEKTTSEIDEKFCDPFIRLICGVLSHPTTFLFTPRRNNNNNNEETYDLKGQTTLDFYQLILSCYIIKLTQLLLTFVIVKAELKNENYLKYNLKDWQSLIAKTLNSKEINDKLTKYLYEKMTSFLRKSLIVYNSFFNKSIDELISVLWSSIDDVDDDNDDEMKEDGTKIEKECDLICDMFHLPTINNILPECWEDEYFKNYLSVINIKYILRLTQNMNMDNLKPLSLINLPIDYNTLFQIAAETKCDKKGRLPRKSGICLLCGKVLCIDCCRYSVIDHCAKCNDGIGVILYFQKSSIILVWNKYATQYESVFLDKYGETDNGLYRGVQLKLNQQRYNQLTQLIVQHLIPNKMTQIRISNHDLLETRVTL